MSRFNQLNVPVYGVSTDSIESHRKFRAKYKLNFPLISDPDHAVIEKFGAWGEKTFMGRTYMGINRSTFVVGPDGRVEHVWDKVKVDGHADEVMTYLAASAAPKSSDSGHTAGKPPTDRHSRK